MSMAARSRWATHLARPVPCCLARRSTNSNGQAKRRRSSPFVLERGWAPRRSSNAYSLLRWCLRAKAGDHGTVRKRHLSTRQDQSTEFEVHVQMVMPESKLTVLLPGAKFSDAYRLVVDEPDLDAITAARRVLERSPRWIRGLMRLRNRITSLLGLKPAELALHDSREESANVGAFRVIRSAPDSVVIGFDDKHV